jgi:ubiquinone/menaquinone biosynthesis C-methylase UbiE
MSESREQPDEQLRIASLLRLLPGGERILEIGARDGYITRRLATRFPEVVALDLEKPALEIPGVTCTAGDVRFLEFPTDSFDVVLCSEVLEHVPSCDLARACNELVRVTHGHVVIGVPFEQDLRVARTRCRQCGAVNPPYGHVNRFEQKRLETLFASMDPVTIEFVGSTREGTNALSDVLMRAAGYPWGTYDQDERCIHCNGRLGPAPTTSAAARALSFGAASIDRILLRRRTQRAKWLHAVFAARKVHTNEQLREIAPRQ